jgi:hypothetical protein
VGLADELRGAVAVGSAWRGAAADVTPAVRAAGLAWLPAVGVALGAAAAAIAGAIAPRWPAAAGVAGVAVLEALGGRPFAVGRAPGIALLALRAWAGAGLGAWRTVGLVVAPMLGRWAVVVQCYGGAPQAGDAGWSAPVGRAHFREFGWASVVAFGLAMTLADGVGLAVVVVAALATVGLRVAAHRRPDRPPGRLVAATGELVETGVLVLLRGFAQLKT